MRIEPGSGHLWVIVAATGGGKRPPDGAASSSEVSTPAQYRSLPDLPASPLQKALHRAAVIAPRRRIVTVVAAEHRRWWQETLWFLPRSNVITQSEHVGSASGILAALLQILERDPEASVVMLPSTHQVQDEQILTSWIHRAVTLAALRPKRLFVLGIEREPAVTAHAYIVAGRNDNRGGFEIVRLLEAPPSVVPVEHPIEHRVLWNSGILAGAGTDFLQLFKRRVPDLMVQRQAISHGVAGSDEYSIDVPRLSDSPSGLDFRRHVLPGQESHLRMLTVPRCGWSDLGPLGTRDTPFGRAQPPQRVDDNARPSIRYSLLQRLADVASRLPKQKQQPQDSGA